MMEYITVSAKTVDDAITEALIQLGVTKRLILRCSIIY